MAQRSEDGREECAAEQEGEEQGTVVAEEEREVREGGGLDSQRMQVKGRQGNQTRSLPVSK